MIIILVVVIPSCDYMTPDETPVDKENIKNT